MSAQTYTYPRVGSPKYSVTIGADGAIVVKQNDWLCKYSMAIHGRGDWVYEFARNRNNRMEPIQESETIRTGETIFHLPTFEKNQKRSRLTQHHRVMDFSNGPAFVVPKSKPPMGHEQIRLAEQYLHREAGIPLSQTKFLGPILLSMNAGGKVIGALAWETVQIVSLTPFMAGIVALTAPFVALASAVNGLCTVINTHNNISWNLGYCYGVTAWVFGDQQPPKVSGKMMHMYRNVLDNLKPAIIENWDEGALAGFKQIQKDVSRTLVNGKPACPWAYRVYMRLIANNNPGVFCKKLSQTIVKTLNTRQAVRDGVTNLINGGCVYNV